MIFSKTGMSFSGLLKVCLLVLGFLAFQNKAHAQANDLMIVEYVDWNSGAGMAVKIVNPTPAVINLSGYSVKVYDNGDASTPNTPQYVIPLTGTIQPCAAIVVGNNAYCTSNCSSTGCNFSNTTLQGVNGNDPVVLMKNNVIIDAIGRVGFTSINNGTSQKIGTTTNALFEHKIVRLPGNISRYSLASGTYDPTNLTTANIWPNNTTTSVTGWTVSSSSCLSRIWNTPTVTVNAGPDQNLGCAVKSINLNALTSAGATVTWSGGKGSFSNPNSNSTIYTFGTQDFSKVVLRATATSGCTQQFDEIIIINGDSTEKTTGFTFTPQNPLVNEPVTFTLQNKTPNQTKGTWNFGDGVTAANQNNPTQHAFATAGTYLVKVAAMNKYGCIDSLSQKITVTTVPVLDIKIPNVFTPNNDGHNDTYSPQLPATTAYSLKVYNRWGVKVFESTSREKEWDGKNTSDGVYYVHLKVTYLSGETATFKLPVTVVR